MLPNFDAYRIGEDPYAGVPLPALQLTGQRPKEIKLSIMMSVFHRRSQLYRTLATLTKQTFKDFEVLIYINDDDQNIEEVINMFGPYLEIRCWRKPADTPRHFDPTPAFNYLYPHTRGEVVAMMQPECMLMKEACWHLYHGHVAPLPDYTYYHIQNYTARGPVVDLAQVSGETCVTLKTLWIEEKLQPTIDNVDWYSDVRELYKLDDFWNSGGLSGFRNTQWMGYETQPWWLVFSFKREADVWAMMKEHDYLRGHASIDLLLINYRHLKGYMDCMPEDAMAVHQDHHRMSVAPDGEQDTVSVPNLQERLRENEQKHLRRQETESSESGGGTEESVP
jgi:hypothetical protein